MRMSSQRDFTRAKPLNSWIIVAIIIAAVPVLLTCIFFGGTLASGGYF
jgi:hypothetical protein